VRDFAFEMAELHAEHGVLSGREGPAERILGGLRSEETPAQKAERLAGLLSETIARDLAQVEAGGVSRR
jgi:hypothetical protein